METNLFENSKMAKYGQKADPDQIAHKEAG